MALSPEEVSLRIQTSIDLGISDIVERGMQRSTTSCFYFSYADPDLPKGTRWLGGCYIPADTIDETILLSNLLKINPGGEAQIWGPFPLQAIKEDYRDRLLKTQQEVEDAVDQSQIPSDGDSQ